MRAAYGVLGSWPGGLRAVAGSAALGVTMLAATMTHAAPKDFSMEIVGDLSTQRSQEGSPFRRYADSVADLVKAKVAAMKPDGGTGADPMVQLTFVYVPLIRNPAAPDSAVPQPTGDGQSRIESPWLTLAIDRGDRPYVRATFVWNERQLLLDQALMAGSVPFDGDTQPLEPAAFGTYLRDYSGSVLLAATPEERNREQSAIGGRIPPDVLWLFRQSWQSTFAQFSMEALSTLDLFSEVIMNGYLSVTSALVERAFSAPFLNERHDSILEFGKVVNLDGYRIGSLR